MRLAYDDPESLVLAPDAARCVLIVDDDPFIAGALGAIFEADGYAVYTADCGHTAVKLFVQTAPCLVMLDLDLPDTHGLVLCADFRAQSEAPIMLMSGTAEVWQQAVGFRLGADDFVEKPFNVNDVRARVATIMSRCAVPAPEAEPQGVWLGELWVHPLRRRASIAGHTIPLSPVEHRLLTLLASNPNRVVTRAELADSVWRDSSAAKSRTIDTHIRRLRAKLEVAAAHSPRIMCEPRLGYVMCTADPTDATPSAQAAWQAA